MQCYTELIAPTAVTHAVSVHLLNKSALNLVVAKTSLLQVFTLKSTTSDINELGTGNYHNRSGHRDQHILEGDDAVQKVEHNTKLELVGEYSLSGTVTSLAKVKALNTKSGGEALLVSFRDAKIALIEWDPENHRISTVSIHYYEGDNIHAAPFGPALGDCESYLTVDPRSRCAALKFGVKHLAILPFRQLGDELAEADLDHEIDARSKDTQMMDAADSTSKETPYAASFVLPLTALDPALAHPVHMAFLYEYREPTFGIVSSNKAPSHALLHERKDPLTYTVFTLDLDQRASTTLLSVAGLPFDIFRVVPLPLPVGGALLVGTNELVHVDQSGKTNGVAVNEYARQSSDFPLADHSALSLRLEDCTIEVLDPATGNMLIVLHTGELAILTFRIDGRSVSGLSVHIVEASKGGHLLSVGASSVASLGRGRLFLGSEDSNSSLMAWSKKSAQLSRKRSHAQMVAEDAELSVDEDEEDADDDVDDDLYGGETTIVKQAASSPSAGVAVPEDYTFRVHDNLPSLGPINNICLGKPATQSSSLQGSINPALSLLAAAGRGNATTVVEIGREIAPNILHSSDTPSAQSVWTVCAKHAAPKMLPKPENGERGPEPEMAADQQYDRYMIIHDLVEDVGESSKVFKIGNTVSDLHKDNARLTELEGTEFDGEGETNNMGTLAAGTRIVQVKKSEVRSYDADLGLSQIFPILDQATDEELQVVHSFFCDPYLLVIRNDSSVQVLEADRSGDLDELERGDTLLSHKWLSGCIYKSEQMAGTAQLFLLDAAGGLQIFELPNLEQPVYSAPGLSALPPVLTTDDRQRRAAARETLTEVLFANLGDASSPSPYLVLRSSTDDIILYEPFHYPAEAPAGLSPFTKNLRFRKVPGLHIPKYNEDAVAERPIPLRASSNVGGYATVFMGGGSPSFILKDSACLPRVVSLKGKWVKGLAAFSSRWCENGFAYVDASGTLRACQLPDGVDFGSTGWAIKKSSPFPSGHELHKINYHSERDLFVLTTSESVDFFPPEDESKAHDDNEGLDSMLRPKTSQYYLHLYDAQTSTIVHTFPLPQLELVTSVECVSLEISEVTHKRKLLIAAGTISQKGEAYAARGGVYVLDVIDVVSEPDQPQTGKKMSLLSREETKGGITSLMGMAGLLGTAQGQKIMFRGLKEDGQCLPVAFLDAQCYLSSLKSLGSSNLWLAADAWKGLWFGGFSEEPYRITLFGKSRSKMEVLAAEFLPFEGQLYLVVVDADLDLHVLQYDPENPKSLSGQRLLHRSTFHIGHQPTSMTLLPSTLSPFAAQAVNGQTNGHASPTPSLSTSSSAPLNHILITTQSGALALLTPLDEPTYRRLSALQGHLASVLEHAAGLNPRAYRSVESEGLGGRGVVDGDLVCRIGELGAGRRAEVLGRAGAEVWGLRSDLEIVTGAGLGYL